MSCVVIAAFTGFIAVVMVCMTLLCLIFVQSD